MPLWEDQCCLYKKKKGNLESCFLFLENSSLFPTTNTDCRASEDKKHTGRTSTSKNTSEDVLMLPLIQIKKLQYSLVCLLQDSGSLFGGRTTPEHFLQVTVCSVTQPAWVDYLLCWADEAIKAFSNFLSSILRWTTECFKYSFVLIFIRLWNAV